jgi:HAMP domain-containing protein
MVGIMATQNTRPKITIDIDKIKATILLYFLICLALFFITGNVLYMWALWLTMFMIAYDSLKRPSKYPPAAPHRALGFSADPYLVNMGIGGTAANEVHKLNQEVQLLRQELERMRYSRY